MANEKYLYTKFDTGATVYVVVRYMWDDETYVDDADGVIKYNPTDKFITMTEHSVLKGLYEKVESRDEWLFGRYCAYFYHQTGGSPAPASDELLEIKEFHMAGDEMMSDFPFELGLVVADAGNGVSSFKTDLSSAVSSYCVGSYLKFASGTLINQVRRISGYNGGSKVVTLSSAFTAVPAANDEFYIVNQ